MNKHEVLVIDDSVEDIFLIEEGFKKTKKAVTLSKAIDGNDALQLMNTRGNNELPDLIILDLRIPGMDGKEILSFIKSDDKTKHIPVIIFTSSSSQNDILETYKLNANCFITKPSDLTEYLKTISGIGKFWFELVKFYERN